MSLSRRGFITGLTLLVAAPAIVRAASLMPVKSMPNTVTLEMLQQRMNAAYKVYSEALTRNLYGDAINPRPATLLLYADEFGDFRVEQIPHQLVFSRD